MSASRDIGVITIVKNRIPQFYALLKSLEASEHKPKELVVVWMTSPSSHSLVQSDYFPVKHCFATSDTLPIARARNRGAAATDAETLLFMDVDCVIHPTLLTQISNTLSRGSTLGSVMTELKMVPENADYAQLSRLPESRGPRQTALQHQHEGLQSSLFAIQRDDFEKVDGFDVNYAGFGIGDIDFATRCNRVGITHKTLPLVTYKQYRNCRVCPLNHLLDIVRNANLYKQKWGYYPKTQWLTTFMARGFVSKASAHAPLAVTRLPTAKEIRSAIAGIPVERQAENEARLSA
ncbi:glycosyltransferase family 2 protein [Alteromonas sp. H39]|uniref:glycosyltransferase family 2 protein n=1 Tax=Alteromonas sp. H39 TaxID=3389876 RepID=UPI0039E1356E